MAVISSVNLPPGSRPKTIANGCDCCVLLGKQGFGIRREFLERLIHDKTPTTFFLTGDWMRKHPEDTKRMMQQPFFEIGNHSWGHQDVATLANRPGGLNMIRKELEQTEAQYKIYQEQLKQKGIIVPNMVKIFRPPYGDFNDAAVRQIEGMGYKIVNWDSNMDNRSPSRNPTRGGGLPQNGSILLSHMRHDYGDTILGYSALKNSGYQFSKVSDLLNAPGATFNILRNPDPANRRFSEPSNLGDRYFKTMARSDYYALNGKPNIDPMSAKVLPTQPAIVRPNTYPMRNAT